MSVRPSQQASSAVGATRSGAPLTATGVMGLQRTVGNRATCQVIKVQRLEHPQFPKAASKMTDMELLEAYRFDVNGDTFGIGLPPKDSKYVLAEMEKRDLPKNSESPLKPHREFFPTRGDVAGDVAKPLIAGGATGAASELSKGLSTHPGAVSYKDPGHLGPLGGPGTTHGAVAAEVLGPLLMGDAALGIYRGSKAKAAAKERGDDAGVRLGTRKMKQQGWGLAGGATVTAGAGVKLGAALGSTAVGLAAAAGGLGVAGGALTALQGSYKIAKAGRKLWDFSSFYPLSKPGEKWKDYAMGREVRKAGINALKVAAGALGIAAGVLLITSNPVGWAFGIAAMVAAGTYGLAKAGYKAYETGQRRNAKKRAEEQGKLDDLAKPGPATKVQGDASPAKDKEEAARRDKVHALADKVAKDNSMNARYASEMIAALQKGDWANIKGLYDARAQYIRNAELPSSLSPLFGNRLGYYRNNFPFKGKDEFFKQTLNGMTVEKRTVPSDDDKARHDAVGILEVIGVSKEEALTESGQDLIQKKLSVAEAS